MKRYIVFLFAFFALYSIRAVFAEDRFESFFNPSNNASYLVAIEPHHNASPRLLHQDFRGTWVVSQNAGKIWTLNGRGARTELESPLFIPPQGPVSPDRLSEVGAGIGFLNKTGDRRQMGVNFSVGSASDELFHSIHETEISATGSAMVPSGERNAWIFLLNYSNNRSFLNNVPLPGFAYMWNKPEKGFRAIAGFPFVMLSYKPNDLWSGRITFIGDTNQSFEVARHFGKDFNLYGAFDRSPLQWLRAGREDRAKRLIYDEKRIVAGGRESVGPVAFDISAGRAVGRRVFEAKDASRDAPRVHLDDTWIFLFKASLRWGARPAG